MSTVTPEASNDVRSRIVEVLREDRDVRNIGALADQLEAAIQNAEPAACIRHGEGPVVTAEFVAVIHGWFMDSNGFTVERIDATTEEDALAVAQAMAHRAASTFNRTAVQLLTLGDKTLLAPRRLTWKERLCGWQIGKREEG